MNIFFVSIFPEIFESFKNTSLISKAIDNNILSFNIINPRDFCHDRHRQVDDEIYGGGVGMLMMAKPVIDAVNSVIENIDGDFKIIFPSPSEIIWNEKYAYSYSKNDNLIFVCGRYEGIDYRFEKYFIDKYPDKFHKISLGKFITLGGELPSMTMVESIVRLIPGVIQDEISWQDESYQISKDLQNLEYPQYTRPQIVEGYEVPSILLKGNHKEIEKWRNENTKI